MGLLGGNEPLQELKRALAEPPASGLDQWAQAVDLGLRTPQLWLWAQDLASGGEGDGICAMALTLTVGREVFTA